MKILIIAEQWDVIQRYVASHERQVDVIKRYCREWGGRVIAVVRSKEKPSVWDDNYDPEPE